MVSCGKLPRPPQKNQKPSEGQTLNQIHKNFSSQPQTSHSELSPWISALLGHLSDERDTVRLQASSSKPWKRLMLEITWSRNRDWCKTHFHSLLPLFIVILHSYSTGVQWFIFTLPLSSTQEQETVKSPAVSGSTEHMIWYKSIISANEDTLKRYHVHHVNHVTDCKWICTVYSMRYH